MEVEREALESGPSTPREEHEHLKAPRLTRRCRGMASTRSHRRHTNRKFIAAPWSAPQTANYNWPAAAHRGYQYPDATMTPLGMHREAYGRDAENTILLLKSEIWELQHHVKLLEQQLQEMRAAATARNVGERRSTKQITMANGIRRPPQSSRRWTHSDPL